jgi:hypothetical protein
MRVLRAALVYFALVLAAGFALGTIRMLFVVPRMGTRAAELMEAPFMLTVTILAARFIVRRRLRDASAAELLGTGFLALGFLMAAELALVAPVRGMSIGQYFAGQDPVSGTVFYLLLAAFAFMPLFVYRR